MLLILLKSSACLAIFMLFYKFCLEQTSAHHLKRFYLIIAISISIGIPFITFTEYIFVAPENNIPSQEFINQPLFEALETQPQQNDTSLILWSIYAIGVIIFSFRFFKNLYEIAEKIKTNPKFKTENFINVLLHDLIHPHTFFNYIFLNKSKYENNLIPTEILLHEQVHAKQKHAVDILFIEILQIVFWFNPLLYFIKKDIKLNHEFLADQAVITNGTSTKQYQQLLLAFSSNASQNQLANAINYSLIKKRFTVMKTKTSKTVIWVRSIVIFPLVAVLIYSFSQKTIIETNQFKELPFIEEGKGVSEAMLKEYTDFTNQYKHTKRIANNSHLRIIAIYKMMTKEQRYSVNKPDFRWYNLNKLITVPRHPTQTEFDSWKKSKEFVFFIDGEVIRTEELNNYTPQDIFSYSNRFATDNNPEKGSYESIRYMLLTKNGFKKSLQDNWVKEYQILFQKYSNEITHYLNSDRLNKTELKVLKSQLDDLYNTLTSEDLKEFNLLKAPDIPNKSYKTVSKKESESSENHTPANPKSQLYLTNQKNTKELNSSQKHYINILVNENGDIFVDSQKVNLNTLSKKIIDIKNQFIDKKIIAKGSNFKIQDKLSVKVKIKGHATGQYLVSLKNEIKKSKLLISSIEADSASQIQDFINRKQSITPTQDTVYKYKQTTKISIDTIKRSTEKKKN